MIITYNYLILILVIFIYFYKLNIDIDSNDIKKLSNVRCHNNMDMTVSETEKNKIEYVIKNYNKHKTTNLSRNSEIKTDVMTGMLSGLLIGFITGLPIEGIITCSVVYGTAAGTIKSIILLHELDDFLVEDSYI